MLDYRQVLAEPKKYRELLLRKGYELPLELIEKLNATCLELTREVEELRRRLNVGSKEISKLRRSSEIDTRKENELREQMTRISKKVAELEVERTKVDSQLEFLMLEIPNIPAEHTPVGQSDQDNLVMRHWGVKPAFDFQPKSHYELAEKKRTAGF
jgi:seryl-tRNA synthetase